MIQVKITTYGQQRFLKKNLFQNVFQAILKLFSSVTFSLQINILEDISHQKYAQQNTTTSLFFSSYVVSELARFARGRIEDSSLTGSRSTAFQNFFAN